jgi:hypothetical protein
MAPTSPGTRRSRSMISSYFAAICSGVARPESASLRMAGIVSWPALTFSRISRSSSLYGVSSVR